MKYELYEKQMKEYFEKMEKLYFLNRAKNDNNKNKDDGNTDKL